MTSSFLDAARRYFTSLYFYPDSDDFGAPDEQGHRYEEIAFKSPNGLLHGFLIHPAEPSKGVVVHCHGNAGNVTAHFPLVTFLVRAGYDVLTFDYPGYGRSQGRPSLPGIEEDARAAVEYVLSRPDLPVDRLAVFGQSLGGAAAAGAAVHPAVRCLVLEATFTTYRDVAYTSIVGKVLFFIVNFVIPDGGPAANLPAFAPRPVLLVHGEADRVVPVHFSRRLHQMFPENSELETVPSIGHLTTGSDQTSPFGDVILRFLRHHLGERP